MATPLFSTKTGLGTAPLGSTPDGPLWWGPQDVETSVATVEAAIDAGAGWIDTAPFSGWGLAERIVGRALRSASHPGHGALGPVNALQPLVLRQ